MADLRVLLLSPSEDFLKKIKDLLAPYGDRYAIALAKNPEETEYGYDLVLFDEDVINEKPQTYLAQYIFEFSPSPVIYLCTHLEDEDEYAAVKSLASDYLFKNQLSSSSLHNCIKYVVESTNLKREIEKRDQRYQSLFYNAVDPAFFLRPDWKIENVNQAFTDAFSSTLHELIGKDFLSLMSDPGQVTELKNNLLDNGTTTYETETRFLKFGKKGYFPGHLKISVLREYMLVDGENVKKITGFHGTLSNISDRKRLQKFRETSERLDMTYRLARTLAHEIRNPLTNITLSINQLEDELEASEDAVMYFDIIKRCTRRIDKLIERLIHAAYRDGIKGSDCDLVAVVKSAVEECRDRAKLRNITIKTDFEADAVPYFCDHEKITLAVSNLITNAIEAIEGDGGQVIVGTYAEDDYYHIYVEDNGIGMDDHQKKSIFDPFFSNKKNGIGMGLTATQGIILEHNGQLDVESEPGMGSTFTISLKKSVLEEVKKR